MRVGQVTTPANWRPGDKVIVLPAVTNDEATKLFGDFQTVKPYLRFTKDPTGKGLCGLWRFRNACYSHAHSH